ncbi:MAG: hypothetical protein SangKO_010990 [Sandaracinaceae bacterium]
MSATPPTAVERFNAWLSDKEMSSAKAAELLGCSVSMVQKVRQGDRVPGLALALAIKRESSAWGPGPIQPSEWVLPAKSAALAPTGSDSPR